MGSLKLESFLLDSKVQRFGKNSCVVDYVWNHIRGRKRFRHCQYDDLKMEIERFAYKVPLVRTYELTRWAKECRPNVSIRAFHTCRISK